MLNAACEQCRLRKVRCDGLEPCTPCMKIGRKQECFRRSRKKRTSRTSKAGDSPPSRVRTQSASPLIKDEGRAKDINPTYGGSTSPFWPFEGHRTNDGLTDEQAAAATLGSLKELPLVEQARRLLVSETIAKDTIVYLYHWRVSTAVHACVFVPDIIRLLEKVFSGQEDGNIADVEIALLLAIVAAGLRSMPRVHIALANRVRPRFEKIKAAFKTPNRAREIANVARVILLEEVRKSGKTLSHIQLICILLHFDTDGGNTNEQLFDHAIRTMRKWPFDRFHAGFGTLNDVQNEMSVRCWWFLVCRDWLGAASTGAYSVQPSHFVCRLPMEIADSRLASNSEPARSSASPYDEYLPVRYSLSIIQFAVMVRRLIDLRIARSLDIPSYCNEVVREFESFFMSLPDAYSLQRSRAFPNLQDERAKAVDAKTTTERWLIQQQCFYALVELHSPITMLTSSRIAVPLAQHILDIRQDVENLCSVTDFFRFKTTNAVNACIILLLHLMQAHRDGSMTFITRDILLGKVRKAVNGSQDLSSSHSEAFALVKELLKIENHAWNGHPSASAVDSGVASSAASVQMAVSPTKTAVSQVLDYTFPPLVRTPASSSETNVSTYEGSGSASASLSSISTPPELSHYDTIVKIDDRKDPDWLASLPSDAAISPLFQPPPDDPNGARFYDAIRSTLLWNESEVSPV